MTASKAPAYLMALPYHPLLNLAWFPFAWLYLRGFAIVVYKSEVLQLGIFWCVICVIINLVGLTLIPRPWQ